MDFGCFALKHQLLLIPNNYALGLRNCLHFEEQPHTVKICGVKTTANTFFQLKKTTKKRL